MTCYCIFTQFILILLLCCSNSIKLFVQDIFVEVLFVFTCFCFYSITIPRERFLFSSCLCIYSLGESFISRVCIDRVALDRCKSCVIELAPEFSPAWTGRASAYLALELHGPALSDLEHALSLDPQNFEALTGLGVILEQLEAPELALRAYDEVLAIHPHLEQVINARSRVAEKVSGLPL